MSLRDKNLVPHEYYHIYNRGNGKHEIFLDQDDYDRFMKILYVCNSERLFNFRDSIIKQKISAFDFDRGTPLVSIVSWVLMPNHFHIVCISPRSDLGLGSITKFMRKVSTAYAMYFNKKYNRTGSLFEGKFKSKHIAEENHFHYLFAYIHLNPIKLIQSDWKEKGILEKDKALNYIKKFPYSSFQEYINIQRLQNKIIDKNILPEYFIYRHSKELFNWIKLQP